MTIPDYLTDIVNYLQTNSIGTSGTDIFLYGFSKSVKNCIAVMSAPGLGDKSTASGDMTLYRPELDIRVRNSSGSTAKTKATAIHALLNLKTNFTTGNTKFKRIQAISEPFQVSKSETEGTIYSVNFSLQIERS